jgi:hypothetical protein
VKLSMFNCKFFISFFFKFSSLFENSVKEKSSIKNHERKKNFCDILCSSLLLPKLVDKF